MKIDVRTGTIQEAVDLSLEIPEFEAPYTAKDYQARLQDTFIILVAEVAGVPIGFKVGYDRFKDGKTFYSWMGGVHPSYRNMGVARLLLQKMELWCRLKGYTCLQFKTLNKHKSMIHFAIDQGFEIVGFKSLKPSSMSKIYFERKL